MIVAVEYPAGETQEGVIPLTDGAGLWGAMISSISAWVAVPAPVITWMAPVPAVRTSVAKSVICRRVALKNCVGRGWRFQ